MSRSALGAARSNVRLLLCKLGLAFSLVVPGALCSVVLAQPGVQLVAQAVDASALPAVSLSGLPVEARQTEQKIRNGGPFLYSKDGAAFGNRERLLPINPRGYYLEYTVKTPGAPDRGARRIVCGGARPTDPDVCFYTDDHYASFRRIVK